MMSKKKILKGLTDHIINAGYCITDYDLSKLPTPCNKNDIKKAMEKDRQELISIRSRLDKLLIG